MMSAQERANQGPFRVLLHVDSMPDGMLIQSSLRNQGLVCVITTTPEEAADLLTRAAFDVLLVAHGTLRSGGLWLISEVLEVYPNLITMLTSPRTTFDALVEGIVSQASEDLH